MNPKPLVNSSSKCILLFKMFAPTDGYPIEMVLPNTIQYNASIRCICSSTNSHTNVALKDNKSESTLVEMIIAYLQGNDLHGDR